MILSRYCLCGGALRGSVRPDAYGERLLAEFDRLHGGDGHGPTDAVTASRARRVEESRREPEGGDRT